MPQDTTLDAWTNVCRALFMGVSDYETVHPVHSCVIDGRQHIFHAPELGEKDPSYFQRLKALAFRHNIQLAVDRRRADDVNPNCRRKKLLPIIFLALGVQVDWAIADEVINQSFGMLPDQSKHSHKTNRDIEDTRDAVRSEVHHAVTDEIETILLKHYKPQKEDPNYLAEAIHQISQYYAMYDEALELIRSIANEPWELRYAPYTFQTDVNGTKLQVESTKVYFDPRSGAKLKFYDRCSVDKPFCVASPADALLHELLHVQTILRNTNEFIAQGGMNNTMYPIEHERITIQKENELYKAMSQHDHRPRPIRNEHTGRHVLVSCVTCLD